MHIYGWIPDRSRRTWPGLRRPPYWVHLVQKNRRFKNRKTNHAPNLMGGLIKELAEQLKIKQDASSAYHPAGNRLAENAVKRIKHAIGDKKIEDAKNEICALNNGVSYSNDRLTAFKALHGLASPVNGIPMTDKSFKELVQRKWVTDKVNAKENPLPTHPENNKTNGEDNHPQTHDDREQ